MTPYERVKERLVLTTDRGRLDIALIHGFLKDAYWAGGIPEEIVSRSIRNSLCFGVYEGPRQVGFARVISDYATFAYLADVFVVESHRGKGIGTWLMECIMSHPDLQGLRKWHLATRDAHALYRRFGFRPPGKPETQMEILDSEIYRRHL